MDCSQRPQGWNQDLIPCECGCGSLIARVGTDGRRRRFVRGHQFKGNTYASKTYDLSDMLAKVEPLRPLCACGCGEKLAIPTFMQQKGYGVDGILSHWRRHPYQPKHGNWRTRTENFISNLEPLSVEILGLIYGTLLGDGAIVYPNQHSRFPRLAWTHGMAQQTWLEYKARRLSALCPKLRVATNQGYGKLSICCRTVCHPQLAEVFHVVRPNRAKKQVSMDWLNRITPEGLAWWYMDDGSLSLSPEGSPRIHFHTEGYSAEENQLLADWLTQLGYPVCSKSYTRATRGKTYFYLAMGATTARKWLSDLKQYAIPTMDYKFGDGQICLPRWPREGL
jgi:hypothetical protein